MCLKSLILKPFFSATIHDTYNLRLKCETVKLLYYHAVTLYTITLLLYYTVPTPSQLYGLCGTKHVSCEKWGFIAKYDTLFLVIVVLLGKELMERIMVSLEETYNQAIRISRTIVEDIRLGRELYLYPVKTCSIEICKYVNDDADILTLLNSAQDTNPYIHSHPVNVAFLSFVIGKWLNLDDLNLVNLVCAGLLHDIGKAKIKDSLLNKADPLTLEEMEKMKSHPVISYKMIRDTNVFDSDVLQGVLFHHERMDGTGYPLRLKGEKINLFSKIIAIADTFDAITATKAYRQKNSPLKAVEEIQANSFNLLDPYICQIFINNMIDYYNGSAIRLSNEQVGNIVYINPIEITKPLVHCENEFHDLSVERDLEVVEHL